MTDTASSDTKREELNAEKKNGVYILGIRNQRVGYSVHSLNSQTWVEDVTIHGQIISCQDYMETECVDFEFTEDNMLNLRYVDTGTNQGVSDR